MENIIEKQVNGLALEGVAVGVGGAPYLGAKLVEPVRA